MTKILLSDELLKQAENVKYLKHCLDEAQKIMFWAYTEKNRLFWEAFFKEYPGLTTGQIWKTVDEDGLTYVVPEEYLEVLEPEVEPLLEEGENA